MSTRGTFVPSLVRIRSRRTSVQIAEMSFNVFYVYAKSESDISILSKVIRWCQNLEIRSREWQSVSIELSRMGIFQQNKPANHKGGQNTREQQIVFVYSCSQSVRLSVDYFHQTTYMHRICYRYYVWWWNPFLRILYYKVKRAWPTFCSLGLFRTSGT